MKAIVLCAGLGTRLRPLTERWPKPAVPLLGVPIFGYTVALLQRAGVTAVGINTHHLPEVMEQVARSECDRRGLPLWVSHEPRIQGTGGGIRGLRDFLGDAEDFVVFNGDILFALDLKAAVEAHRGFGGLATMVLLPMPHSEKFNPVEVDASGEVRRVAGKGPGGARLRPWHFSGVHVINRRVFERMRPEGPEDIVHDVYLGAIAAGERVHGHLAQSAYWSDLGTPSRFLATQKELLFGQVPAAPFGDAFPLGAERRVRPNLWGREHLRASGPALIEGEVAQDAQIGSAVHVAAGATVASGCRLNRAAVMPETRLGEGEELVDAIAWRSHRIAAKP